MHCGRRVLNKSWMTLVYNSLGWYLKSGTTGIRLTLACTTTEDCVKDHVQSPLATGCRTCEHTVSINIFLSLCWSVGNQLSTSSQVGCTITMVVNWSYKIFGNLYQCFTVFSYLKMVLKWLYISLVAVVQLLEIPKINWRPVVICDCNKRLGLKSWRLSRIKSPSKSSAIFKASVGL